jgi:eukaryotic-like serine/threonine-protein kinase
MAEERRQRVWALFNQAVGLPPGERTAFLDAACPDDPGLRAEAAALLAHDGGTATENEGFLTSPMVRADGQPPPLPGQPPRPEKPAAAAFLGRYRLVRRLGEGGMGTVYEAEQEKPRRPVALKVIRPGLLSPTLVRRFSHEAEYLGRLQHPGIAQVFEAGVAEDGQPYFAAARTMTRRTSRLFNHPPFSLTPWALVFRIVVRTRGNGTPGDRQLGLAQ